MELERIVRILKGYGHPEAEAVDIARRILAALEAEPELQPARQHLTAA